MNFFWISLIVSFSLFIQDVINQSASRYPITPTGMAKELESGTIIDVREVTIDGRTSVVGTATGTLSGAVLAARLAAVWATRVLESPLERQEEPSRERS